MLALFFGLGTGSFWSLVSVPEIGGSRNAYEATIFRAASARVHVVAAAYDALIAASPERAHSAAVRALLYYHEARVADAGNIYTAIAECVAQSALASAAALDASATCCARVAHEAAHRAEVAARAAAAAARTAHPSSCSALVFLEVYVSATRVAAQRALTSAAALDAIEAESPRAARAAADRAQAAHTEAARTLASMRAAASYVDIADITRLVDSIVIHNAVAARAADVAISAAASITASNAAAVITSSLARARIAANCARRARDAAQLAAMRIEDASNDAGDVVSNVMVTIASLPAAESHTEAAHRIHILRIPMLHFVSALDVRDIVDAYAAVSAAAAARAAVNVAAIIAAHTEEACDDAVNAASQAEAIRARAAIRAERVSGAPAARFAEFSYDLVTRLVIVAEAHAAAAVNVARVSRTAAGG